MLQRISLTKSKVMVRHMIQRLGREAFAQDMSLTSCNIAQEKLVCVLCYQIVLIVCCHLKKVDVLFS